MFHLFQSLRIAILFLFCLPPIVGAQTQNLNPTGEGCVDPQGFLGCYSTIESTSDSCVSSFCQQFDDSSDEYQTCVLSCYYVQLAGNIGCWIESCWNMIYSCEYQSTCIEYLNNVEGGLLQNTVYIPFYPPPEHAQASCSCNIGEVYGNITAVAIDNADVCSNSDWWSQPNSQEFLANCECCQASQILSNVFDLCPSSDLSELMNVTAIIQSYQQIASYSEDKCDILNTDPGACESTYGLSISENKKWLNPFSLPGGGIPGTQPLSNGPGSITAVTPATIVLELFPAVTTTIIPVDNPANHAAQERREIALVSRISASATASTPTITFISPPQSHTTLSTVTAPPNTSTLNCPTKTLYTVPTTCPPHTPIHACPEPDCIAEKTISVPCDCPDRRVYTEYIPLACPTGCDIGCGTGYITGIEACLTLGTTSTYTTTHTTTTIKHS